MAIKPKYSLDKDRISSVCDPIEEYRRISTQRYKQNMSGRENIKTEEDDIHVIELFAGVGGFRIGLERANKRFKTIWNNQWEPSTKKQDASEIYCKQFGKDNHFNVDISTVEAEEIPTADLLVGGFPCQDYSVATTLSNSKGIEGKKGVLWWDIERIVRKSKKQPNYLFLENVDRLLGSPAKQRGRDFAIILASLSDLGYFVEWRIINAAEYGMPQRRRRTYIIAYHKDSKIGKECKKHMKFPFEWVLKNSVIASAFPAANKNYKNTRSDFEIEGNLAEVSNHFNKSEKNNAASPFGNAGIMVNRHVWSTDVVPVYDGPYLTLGQLLIDEKDVPEEFFITNEQEFEKWSYLKDSKSEKRVTKDGYEYNYTEGSMVFPDALDKPSRTIITGEGGASPSRFKHVIKTPSGKYRRLVPIELERLNMFPDNHTEGATDMRRAFLMGNALVTGIIEKIGLVLNDRM